MAKKSKKHQSSFFTFVQELPVYKLLDWRMDKATARIHCIDYLTQLNCRYIVDEVTLEECAKEMDNLLAYPYFWGYLSEFDLQRMSEYLIRYGQLGSFFLYYSIYHPGLLAVCIYTDSPALLSGSDKVSCLLIALESYGRPFRYFSESWTMGLPNINQQALYPIPRWESPLYAPKIKSVVAPAVLSLMACMRWGFAIPKDVVSMFGRYAWERRGEWMV